MHHLSDNHDIGGPADLAGIHQNDRIIEVNGTNIEKFDHGQVVRLVRDSGDIISFKLAAKNTDNRSGTPTDAENDCPGDLAGSPKNRIVETNGTNVEKYYLANQVLNQKSILMDPTKSPKGKTIIILNRVKNLKLWVKMQNILV